MTLTKVPTNEEIQLAEIGRLRRDLVELQICAKQLCNVRYSDAPWEELNEAIGNLTGQLQRQGVTFDNPRIR